ncbi:type I-E CRISPR-associated protein Cas6/Cse3/CasE [Donghicola mangrovi]|uniref:Type I-E CRISPR-associated protein Cas6/Cse3/CasE n=1 Tax=Donghicola mangrovi TaxID=2729614 RepID=A0A850Q1T2_9RHOB|nr:type I-E CRISPR-associated protein Cas6/Cse3/CasE [Donghicola mangrovi]NVO23046.1 type I-E CRISPR-associated protein Cas6/Cse3/CasE [Donghicola mangrovi]
MYLTKASLSRAPSVKALDKLLMPSEAGNRTDTHHRLLWTLFADSADRTRDFLWREEGKGTFLILSERPPVPTELFANVDSKPFAPDLGQGDRLRFALRANATRSKDKKRVDVVMDALYALPSEERAEQRMDVATAEGSAWMERQGAAHGFRVLDCVASDYTVHALPAYRGPRDKQPQFGILDLEGELQITEPAAFVAAVGKGFGRAKAFGCGLMLLRRAS